MKWRGREWPNVTYLFKLFAFRVEDIKDISLVNGLVF